MPGSSRFTYCWSLSWSILSITLLEYEMSAFVRQFENCLLLSFFGIGIKTDLFQSHGPCWVFQICWHIECSTFTALSFRIWNSSTEIPSLPLVLLIWMLPKRPTWLCIPGCLALGEWSHHCHGVVIYLGHKGLFCIIFWRSSLYSCHLLLISSASVNCIAFLSFIMPIFAWTITLVSLILLKKKKKARHQTILLNCGII